MIPDWINKFTEWIKEHPYKTMFFIQIPICIIISYVTTKLSLS